MMELAGKLAPKSLRSCKNVNREPMHDCENMVVLLCLVHNTCYYLRSTRSLERCAAAITLVGHLFWHVVHKDSTNVVMIFRILFNRSQYKRMFARCWLFVFVLWVKTCTAWTRLKCIEELNAAQCTWSKNYLVSCCCYKFKWNGKTLAYGTITVDMYYTPYW